MSTDKTTEDLLPWRAAWAAYFLAEELASGIDHNNELDAMRHAFRAGWKAAKEDQHDR